MTDEKKKAYQSTWQDQLRETANKILNREKFSYDMNGDALAQQYKNQYTQQGKQAMMDTMGQAAAMTGGYGNSYAQSVGQQAYQGYMQQMNDKIPTLYQMALDKYNAEGNQLLNNMSLMMQQDELEYGRYRDQMADQDAAYSRLLALMSGYGYKPTEQEMASAGMTQAQMEAILGLNKPAATKTVYVDNGGQKEEEWETGIDTTRNQSGLKGSAWDYTKNNLRQLVNSGNDTAAYKYMDQIVGSMSEEQYNEAIKIIEGRK